MNDRINYYLKKINDMLANDPYYQKLTKNIDAGSNSYKIMQKRSIKVVDHDWLDFIEDVLPNLDTIVRNPRRFIVVEEDIIDISLAKSISKESVKHLATHTNLISAVDGDRVIPSKILNVQKEESFEVYENRFLFTLLNKLSEFVKKRYEMIKKSILDSDRTQIYVESHYTMDQTQLIFRLDTIANMGFEEVQRLNNEDLTDYERVARMQSIISGFMGSAFAKEMKSCAPVRPPIMHTNVIKKDPNFKKALKLWDFIFNYDKPGFHVEYINEATPVTKEISPDFKAIMYLNHLAVTNLFENGNNDDLSFNPSNTDIDDVFEGNEVSLADVLCVDRLEIYLLSVGRELKDVIREETYKIDNNSKSIKRNSNQNTVKVLSGYLLTNKFKNLEKKYIKEFKHKLRELKKDEYKPYSLKEVKDEYEARLKEMIFNAYKQINEHNFGDSNEEES